MSDVQTYVTSHTFPAGPTVHGAPPKIEAIQLMTSGEAASKTGEYTGLTDNASVYYVLVRGPFIPINVKLPPGSQPPGTVEEGWEIFDAHTGNILVWGLI
ncbi:MAG: hypothetical protein ABI324_29790 [Ktedonobacteraceae bacterium]